MAASNRLDCVVCGAGLAAGLAPWHHRCSRCGYEAGDLLPAINEPDAAARIDEAAREQGLAELRRRTSERLVAELVDLTGGRGGRLMEVGPGHGWFLEAAARHFEASGLEADHQMWQRTFERRLPVVEGFFPEALQEDARYDVLAFNDVFEHLPDLERALDACRDHLSPKGVLMLALPSSRGTFYRLARRLARLGLAGPFNRLWQAGLPSPHLHYFHPGNLPALLERCGFTVVRSLTLPAVTREGLLARLSFASKLGPVAKRAIWLPLWASIPLIQRLESDHMALFAITAAARPPRSWRPAGPAGRRSGS